MADSEGDSVSLLPEESKKRRLTDFQKCLICQVDSAEALRRAKPTSLSTFISAAEERKDNIKVRLEQEMQDLEFKDIFWHAGCYASYTSKTNIDRVKVRKLETSVGPQSKVDILHHLPGGQKALQSTFFHSVCLKILQISDLYFSDLEHSSFLEAQTVDFQFLFQM